jgi:hypothetical protein
MAQRVEHHPCMDAPVRARCFRAASSCDRVRSCIRPSVAAVTDRRPVWRCADQAQINEASCELCGCYCISWSGSDRSIALTVRRPPHTPDVPLAVVPISRSGRNSHRNPIIFAFCQHGPNRAGHLVGNCDRHQHTRFAREHAMQPASLRRSFPTCPTHDDHRATNQKPPNVALSHLRSPSRAPTRPSA